MSTARSTAWQFGPSTLLLTFSAIATAILSYWGGLTNLVFRWETEEEYSHGFFIPVVTAYFLWKLGPTLAKSEYPPSWSALGAILIALAMLLVGELSAIYLLIHYSFILVLLGISLALIGWKGTRLTAAPIAILSFAIPIPYFLEATLTSKLQLLSSMFGVALVKLWGIPVYREGNLIDLGAFKLEVIEACSGLTYLYPLIGFGAICAYLYQARAWKRVAIIASAIPVTIIINSFRIGMIGVLVKYFGIDQAKGFLHDFEGFAVFMVGVAILFLEMWGLSYVGGNSRSFWASFGATLNPTEPDTCETTTIRPFSAPLVACFLAIVAAGLLVNLISGRVEIKPDRAHFSEFPQTIGQWHGERGALDPEISKALGVTDYILSDYTAPASIPINFYVAYYDSQRKGISPHSPSVCLPGGGWQIIDLRRERVTDSQSGDQEYNRVLIRKGNITQLVYYWFQERGRMMADEYKVKWYLFRDSIIDNRTDGALVRLTTIVSPEETTDSADARLQRFMKETSPLIAQYVPN